MHVWVKLGFSFAILKYPSINRFKNAFKTLKNVQNLLIPWVSGLMDSIMAFGKPCSGAKL
jgi:hypothetical protein